MVAASLDNGSMCYFV